MVGCWELGGLHDLPHYFWGHLYYPGDPTLYHGEKAVYYEAQPPNYGVHHSNRVCWGSGIAYHLGSPPRYYGRIELPTGGVSSRIYF